MRFSNSERQHGHIAIWLAGALLVFGFIVWLFPQETLGLIPKALTVDQPAERADAIVVLLGGDGPRRILKTYQLFRDGKAPLIVFGSGFEDQEALKGAPPGFVWLPSSADYEAALMSLKVPKSDYAIVDTKRSFDSADELHSIASFLARQGVKSVILVTARAHSRRVDLIWNRISPDIKHATVPAPDPELDQWWRSNRATHAVVYELAGLAKECFRQLTHLAGLN